MSPKQTRRSPRPAKIRTVEEYRRALQRMEELAARGFTARTNKELALLEGTVVAYVSEYGKPDLDLGRPPEKTPLDKN